MRWDRTAGNARRWWAVAAVATALLLAGCSGGGRGTSASRGESSSPGSPTPPAAAGGAGSTAKDTTGSPGLHLTDLQNRIVRTATVDLEVGKGDLSAAIDRASGVVTGYRGIYVGSNTSVPNGGPARGEVTFRVPVLAFEGALRDLKRLGTYRGEQSSTDDVTNQYVDLSGQLKAWRAQEKVYLQLLDKARSIADVIAVQNQLQQVQSNIERLQGQVDYLDSASSYSTIVLDLSEPGAAPATSKPRSRVAKAWATAVSGLAVMAATLLVLVIWLIPVAVLALLLLLVVRAARRLRFFGPGQGRAPSAPPAA